MKNMSDMEIAKISKLEPISDIAKKAGIINFTTYGATKAKVESIDNPKGNLILVTAINPTPAGEGKTTTSIGLADAMNAAGHKTILALREPSLGPVFGRKGGATGGGKAQIAPIDEINLHFTGDFHAITTANNLLSAAIDNHIYFGNNLNITKVIWSRCIDMNDRALRNIIIKNGKTEREESFQITAASELMAIFCLARDMNDLRYRLDNIIVGYAKEKPIFAKELNVVGSMIALLKESFKPNLVQTLENNPALVHGGPFANIAHGCNSILATKTALSLADYTVTEAGFGSDLGAEKFMNIKARIANISPNVIVLVATIRALKMQGGAKKDELDNEDITSLSKGIKNLEQHISILKSFNIPLIVTLNHFVKDYESELNFMKKWAKENAVEFSISKIWEKGSNGGQELVESLLKNIKDKTEVNYTYDLTDSIETKMQKLAKTIYGTNDIVFSDDALTTIEYLKKNKLDKKPICVAKTPSSLSSNPKLMGAPKDFTITINKIKLSNGAGFITLYCDDILVLPGLPKKPAAERIDVINGIIEGVS
ncbi:formate--tetrahydrofolate ligase [Mycoplasma todarodis]|uniref:Formate--tetrahydrofolate ligase n=1 Tax=Mycoplasma todarodis TaxID=1937191 RepID=A0A4R0XT56_9MOLU|nr:formate--tetrahydrofolate ligase [Mycoplasma todarodis]TCG11650.1 formate--tetrahydrofolate ligase [Mycoplasma todarodis]